MIKKASTLVFDLDDTLYPEYTFVSSGFKAVDQSLKETHSIEGFFPLAQKAFNLGIRGNIFNVVCDQLQLKTPLFLIADMVDVYRSHTPEIKLFEDAQEMINHFRENKNLGIITDGLESVQKAKIKALSLEEPIDCITCTDQWGQEHWKPHTKAFEHIMQHFNVKPEDCIYIGDNPKKDFIPAKKLNWKTIRIERPVGEYSGIRLNPDNEAEEIINSLTEIKEMLL